ncbi:bola protein [Kockovaella imperatae]|uniref:Bola protein n=1 Tax=Kockovaella imperatae TaxID=4999 RepID=A0A1Y1U6W0_9TREE|nr:bola protein [Kockovaella imperatae]ORX33732.1 bola protein [Kockovaella imperatae]
MMSISKSRLIARAWIARPTSSSSRQIYLAAPSASSSSASRPTIGSRAFSDTSSRRAGALSGEHVEKRMEEKLRKEFNPTRLGIQDTSGGCGSFFNIDIESEKFVGMTKVKQHKAVQNAIKEEIEGMHGVSLRTSPPGE